MTDKTGQEFRVAFEAGEFAADASAQMTAVGGHKVRQPPVLDMRPDLLVGIEFGRITGEPLRPYFRVLRQPDPHCFRPVMRVASVPHDCDWPPDVPQKMAEELHHVQSGDVPVIRKKAEVQVALLSPRTERDGADGRDAVAAVPGRERRCFPARARVRRRVGMSMKPDSSGKTRWAPLRQEFFYARPFFALPPRNFPLIPLTGAAFRLLAAPPQPPFHDPQRMVITVDYAKMPPHQLGNPRTGPKTGMPSVCGRALQQKSLQLQHLLVGQFGRTPRMGFGRKPFRPGAGRFLPAVD